MVRSAVRVDARRAVVRKDMLSVVFGLERKGKVGRREKLGFDGTAVGRDFFAGQLGKLGATVQILPCDQPPRQSSHSLLSTSSGSR